MHLSKNDLQKLSERTKWATEYYKSKLLLLSPAIIKNGYLKAWKQNTL